MSNGAFTGIFSLGGPAGGDLTGTYPNPTIAIKGTAGGLATLDGSGKLTTSQIPTALVGALVFAGTWNASTNSPTLTSGSGTKGNYFVVSAAGSTNLDGISTWDVRDWAVFNGTNWEIIYGAVDSGEIVAALGYMPLAPLNNLSDVASTVTSLSNIGGIGAATTNTLTNKTLDTAGTGNVFKINGTAISAVSGTGSVVLSASPTITGTLAVPYISTGSSGSTKTILSMTSNGAKYGTIQVEATASQGAWSLGYQSSPNSTIGTAALTWDGSGNVTIAGIATHSGATTLSGALTYGGVTLSNSVTGTGSMALSASPTFTGTLTGATGTFTSTLTGAGVVVNGGGVLTLNGGSVIGDLSSGIFLLRNNANTAGVSLDVSTDGTAKFRNRANSSDAAVTVGAMNASGTITGPDSGTWSSGGFTTAQNVQGTNVITNGGYFIANSNWRLGAFGASQIGLYTSGATAQAVIDFTTQDTIKFRNHLNTGDAAISAGAITATASIAVGGASLGGYAASVAGGLKVTGSINTDSITINSYMFAAGGQLGLRNNAQTAEVILDFNTNNILKVFQSDGSTWGTVQTGTINLQPVTALTSGGSTSLGMLMSSTNVGLYAGTGTPTISAAKGSIYLENGTGAPYYNTNGTTGWTSLAGGSGTVTSIQVSGGTTGLTYSGGPITTTGTITMSGTLAVANGGTGVTSSTGSGNVVLSASPTFTGTISAAAASLTGTLSLTQVAETYTAPTISSGTLTIDLSTGTVFKVANSANITTFTISNATASKASTFTLFLTANGTGYTQSWGSVKWAGGTAPTLTTTNAKIDILVFTTYDGGTTWFGTVAGQAF